MARLLAGLGRAREGAVDSKVDKVHARVGLEPSWYIGGYALVLESLLTKVLDEAAA